MSSSGSVDPKDQIASFNALVRLGVLENDEEISLAHELGWNAGIVHALLELAKEDKNATNQ